MELKSDFPWCVVLYHCNRECSRAIRKLRTKILSNLVTGAGPVCHVNRDQVQSLLIPVVIDLTLKGTIGSITDNNTP